MRWYVAFQYERLTG